jgi:hypothetical protein
MPFSESMNIMQTLRNTLFHFITMIRKQGNAFSLILGRADLRGIRHGRINPLKCLTLLPLFHRGVHYV